MSNRLFVSTCVVVLLVGTILVNGQQGAPLASTRSRTLIHRQYKCTAPLLSAICSNLQQRYGALNLATMDATLDGVTTRGQFRQTVIRSVFSTIGIPTAAVMFYEKNSNVDDLLFDVDWSNVFNALLNKDKKASEQIINTTRSGYVLGVAIPRIIEFRDVNRNNVYDEGTDIVISDYNFQVEAEWLPMNVTDTSRNSNGDRLIRYVASTDERNPVARLTFTTATQKSDLDLYSLSPNSLKIDIEIRYPFEGVGDTRVAVQQYVFSSLGTWNSRWTNNQIPFEDYMVYTWVTSADVDYEIDGSLNKGKVEVDTGEWVSYTKWNDTGLEYGLTSQMNTIYANARLQSSYFSFRSPNRPSRVLWDPQLFVTPTLENTYYSNAAPALSSSSNVLLMVVIVMFCMFLTISGVVA